MGDIRHHGYPTLGEIIKTVAIGIVTAPVMIPYRAIKRKIEKKKNAAKS